VLIALRFNATGTFQRLVGDSKRKFLEAIEKCFTSDYMSAFFVTLSARLLLITSRSAAGAQPGRGGGVLGCP